VSRTGGALALLAALALAGVIVLRFTDGGRGRRAPEVSAAPSEPAPRDEPDVAAEPPRASTPVPELEPAREVATPNEEPHTLRAQRELAALLGADPFDPVVVGVAARCLARPLDAAESDRPLRAIAADGQRPWNERLAACELLRELGTRKDAHATPLPESVLAELASLIESHDQALAVEPAARALAALGTARDAQVLIHGVANGDSRCARALACSRDPQVALDLVRALHQSGDARAKELFLTSLAAMVTAAGDAIDPLVREELAAGVQGFQVGVADERLRRRALAVMAALGPLEDGSATLRAARPEELASLGADAPLSSELELVLTDPAQPRALRAALAERVASDEDAPTAQRLVARDVLLDWAASDDTSSNRRRALHALGSLADPSAAPVVEVIARSEPNATLRSACMRALGSMGARDALARLASTEQNADVRKLAESELARLQR